VDPWQLLKALLGGASDGPGAWPGVMPPESSSAHGGPAPPFAMPGGPAGAGAEEIEEVTETKPNGTVCTTTIVWVKRTVKENKTRCHDPARPSSPTSRRLQADLLQNTWVLGGVFLKEFVTVLDFDNKRIGFADPAWSSPTAADEVGDEVGEVKDDEQEVGEAGFEHEAKIMQEHEAKIMQHELRQPLAYKESTHKASGGGSLSQGATWGVATFGVMAMGVVLCGIPLARKMNRRKMLTAPIDKPEEEGEPWETDAMAAIAE